MKSLVGVLVLIASPTALGQSFVEVARVVTDEVNLGQRIIGTVQPLRTSVIGSALDGRVLHYDVNAGEPVKAGQRLAQLRTETLQIQLAAARAQLALSQHQLAELQNGSLPEDIAEAEANMHAAKATMEYADARFRRLTTLSASRAASDDELETAKEQADATRFAWMATNALLKRIMDGPRVEVISQAEAGVELQTHQVELLEDQIEKLSIVSPFDGFVSTGYTEVGAWISRGDPVAQVVELSEIEIQVPVPAQFVVNLHVGDEMRVEFPELPDKLFVGVVQRIVPVAESRARTFPVFVRMPNEIVNGKPTLMAGMLARVELPAERRELMPLVPKDALVLNGSNRSVFVVEVDSEQVGPGNPTGKVREVPVDLGVAWGGLIQVRGNLQADQFVVVTGNERLVSGSSVEIVRVNESAVPPLRTTSTP